MHARKVVGLAAAGWFVLASSACGPQSAPGTPAKAALALIDFPDLLQTKRPDDLQLSPDGRLLAFVQTTNDLQADVPRRTLTLLDLSSGAVTELAPPDVQASLPRWSPDGTRLAFLATDSEGRSSLELVDAPGGTPRPLLSVAGVTSLAWSPDGTRLAFTAPAAESDATGGAELSVVEVASGNARTLLEGVETAEEADWSPDGRSIALTTEGSGAPGGEALPSIQVVDVETGAARQVSAAGVRSESPHWSPDSARLAYLSFPGQTVEEQALAVGKLTVVPAEGGPAQIVAPGFEYLPERIAWSADGGTLLFAAFTRETGQLFTVTASGGTPVQATNESGIAFQPTFSRDRSVMAFVRESPEAPPEVWVSPGLPRFDPAQRTSLNASLQALPLGRGEVVTWTSSDGLSISGVLVRPVGVPDGQHAPLLVVSHGGPIESVVAQWMDSWLLAGAQQWANRGWAVFFPNYRGSTRHGQAFTNALIGQVGKGDFADVMTGVDALIARGIADPDRLVHTGWSYGGFLSGWANTHTSRFKAIVAGAGPYDWAEQFEQATDPASKLVSSILFEGTPEERPQAYRESSVSTFIGDARTPTLVMYGDEDATVATSQPQELHDALVAQGVATDLVIFAGEPHILVKPSDQLTKLQREQEWIVRFTVPASEAPPAAVARAQ